MTTNVEKLIPRVERLLSDLRNIKKDNNHIVLLNIDCRVEIKAVGLSLESARAIAKMVVTDTDNYVTISNVETKHSIETMFYDRSINEVLVLK